MITRQTTRSRRNPSGQAIAEGAAALVLITALLVAAILLLVNCGLAAYYKQKLAVVSSKAADYAASQPAANRLADTQAFVLDLLKALNVSVSGADVSIQSIQVHGKAAQSVTIKAHGLPLVGNLFGAIDMEDTGIGTAGMAFSGTAYVYDLKPGALAQGPTALSSSNSDIYMVPLIRKDSDSPAPLGVLSGVSGPILVESFSIYDSASQITGRPMLPR